MIMVNNFYRYQKGLLTLCTPESQQTHYWNEEQEYYEGEIVNYEGLLYIALRWSINEVPLLCESGAWQMYERKPQYSLDFEKRIGFASDHDITYGDTYIDRHYLDFEDEETIKKVLKAYSFKKIQAFNSSEAKICSRLLLATVGDDGTYLQWESNAPEVISNTGEVIRPTNGKDYPVWLKLTVSKGNVSVSKVFELWVKAEGSEIEYSEEESVELAYKTLCFHDFKGKNTNILEIKHKLDFILEGRYGTKLHWLSMQKDFLKDDGNLVLDNILDEKVVKLHVRIAKGKAQKHKRFYIRLLP